MTSAYSKFQSKEPPPITRTVNSLKIGWRHLILGIKGRSSIDVSELEGRKTDTFTYSFSQVSYFL